MVLGRIGHQREGGRSGGDVSETEMDLASDGIQGLRTKMVVQGKVGTTLIRRLTVAWMKKRAAQQRRQTDVHR